ncbi:MAG: hypothetical protein JSR14_06735 [Proteobacteria bacterium]|nr:hypothetical protein [Pseudomonadota bacterium]
MAPGLRWSGPTDGARPGVAQLAGLVLPGLVLPSSPAWCSSIGPDRSSWSTLTDSARPGGVYRRPLPDASCARPVLVPPRQRPV